MNESSERIDFAVLSSIRMLRREGKPDPLEKIVTLFGEHSLRLLESMKNAVSQGEAQLVRETAHSLKSSSGNVGAVKLSSLCKEMEEAGRKANIDAAMGLLPQIQEEYERAKEALEQYVKDHP